MCAADEVWRLQRGSEADAVFFQRAVNRGERITDRGTRQGTWVFAASGKVLGRVNSRDPERNLVMLREALAAWQALPAEERRLPADVDLTAEHRWEHSLPADGLILSRASRELVGERPTGERSRFWNRDVVWASADELAAWVPADLKPGSVFSLAPLARRLAQLHLIDDVRGQGLPFAPAEVRRAELRARVASMVGGQLVLELAGHTLAEANDDWLLPETSEWRPPKVMAHGLEARLAGRAVWNRDTKRFEAFELLALARRHGRTNFNGRGRGAEGPGRMAFHLALADPPPPVAPTFAGEYGVDWIELPSTPNWRDSPRECGLESDG